MIDLGPIRETAGQTIAHKFADRKTRVTEEPCFLAAETIGTVNGENHLIGNFDK